MGDIGLAFSGGGIRSAAFCSGVLRRLLNRNVEVDYLSCVSGGGYTGSAFLDWKYRKGKKEDDEKWHKDFFDHMRERAGYLCNWKKPREGILDTIILLSLVLFITFIGPIIIWGSYACPIAFIIDFLFGKYLREVVDCDDVTTNHSGQSNPTLKPAADQNATTQAIREHCLDRQGTHGSYTIILFSVLFVLFVIFFVLAKSYSGKKKYCTPLSFIYSTVIFCLALVLFPFVIHNFLIELPSWTQCLLVFIGVMVWFFLPLLRSKTSYVLMIYFYSYFIYWKVYEGKLIGIEFSGEQFNRLLFASGIALWMVPLLTALHKRLMHVYNRWRLQKAFYHPDGLGCAGCSGIEMQDICPLWIGCCQAGNISSKTSSPLSLKDLKGIKPEYISNIVVNRWKESYVSTDENYELLTMSSSGIECLDAKKRELPVTKLKPEDIKLSEAMATSAAALSQQMGQYDSVEGLIRFHTLLGLEMGATKISDLKSVKNEHVGYKILTILVDIARALPLIMIYVDIESSIEVGVITFFVIHFVLAFIAVTDTGMKTPKRWEKLARWFIVHNSFVHYVREMFSKDNCGPKPPPVMLLSDGGHVENLGLLPLLKKQLKKIIVVDGGYKDNEQLYGKSISKALELARTKLNCSFSNMEGHDVNADLEKFVKPKDGKTLSRHYRFKVQYENDESGDILLVVPRKPGNDIRGRREKKEEDEEDACPTFDQPDGLRRGMFLNQKDVDKLTLCCCDCCHRSSCQGCSTWFCKAFPLHHTANQFFTPRMFEAYHREGYRACKESEADKFIIDCSQPRYFLRDCEQSKFISEGQQSERDNNIV